MKGTKKNDRAKRTLKTVEENTLEIGLKEMMPIMVIFKCYFSGEHIALSIIKNNNGVNIELGKTNRLKALCMMQINT